MLVAKDLLLLLVAEVPLGKAFRIRGRPLADAASSHEHLRLQDKLVFASLTLHVIHSVALLHIRIEAKNHAKSIQYASENCMSFKTAGKAGLRGLTLLRMDNNLERL